MRKQFHFQPNGSAFDAWDVDRLIELSRDLPVETVAVADIAEVDTDYWFGVGPYRSTVRAVAEHAALIREVETQWPIILANDGRVMDGMHRVARALMDGRATVDAVRFAETPSPDHVDVQPEDLSYDR